MKRATTTITQSAVSPGFLIPARGGLIYIELHTSHKELDRYRDIDIEISSERERERDY